MHSPRSRFAFGVATTTLVLATLPAIATPALSAQQVDTLAFKDLSYRMVGPFRGGRSSAATGFLNDPDRWLMGTTGGGMWESTDNGVTWENITDGYFGGSIGAVRVADSDPNVIYVGQGSAGHPGEYLHRAGSVEVDGRRAHLDLHRAAGGRPDRTHRSASARPRSGIRGSFGSPLREEPRAGGFSDRATAAIPGSTSSRSTTRPARPT